MPELELPSVARADLGWPAWVFLALVILIGVGAWASRRALESGAELPAPGRLYPQLAVQLLVVGAVTLFAARSSGVELFAFARPTPAGLLAWRALLPALLLAWTGNAWLAVGLSALSFGLAHRVQGRLAMLTVFVVAVLFQALVVATGDLLLPIAVHAAYDTLVGLGLSPYLRRGASGGSASP